MSRTRIDGITPHLGIWLPPRPESVTSRSARPAQGHSRTLAHASYAIETRGMRQVRAVYHPAMGLGRFLNLDGWREGSISGLAYAPAVPDENQIEAVLESHEPFECQECHWRRHRG